MKLQATLLPLLLLCSNLILARGSSNNIHVTTPTSSTSSVTAVSPPSITTETSSAASTVGGGGTNPVFQLAGYVKDSFVRMKDGTVQLYTNHQRCKSIRSKQKLYLEQKSLSLPENEQKAAKKYSMSAGGITYEEFDFLQKGKEDRGRLANMVFMMVFAPNFVPYAFMFFPDMLPSSFSMSVSSRSGMNFSKWDMISRERAHAVLQTMIDVERSARVAPLISNLNPFGKGRVRRNMEKMENMGHACGALLSADEATGRNGAELVMKVLEDEIYSKEEPNKGRTALTFLPKSIVKGLGRAMDAPSSNSFLPTFLVRGKVLNNLSQIKDSDEFIVDQNINLNSLDMDLLQDACNKRLIGGPGCTKGDMVEGLSSWMDLTVKKPQEKVNGNSGKCCYNGNLARVALLCYNAIDGARDARASSFLPRLMYQGQMYSSLNKNVQINSDSRKGQPQIKGGGKSSNESPSSTGGRRWFK